MGFWAKLQSSLYSPAFYAKVAEQPLSSAFKYYFSLVAILSLLVSALLSLQFIPALQEFSDTTVQEMLASIPADLSLRIQNNVASTNSSSTEPIFFPIPAGFSDTSDEPVSGLVIDTTRKFSYDQFEAYRSFLWIAQDGIGLAEQGPKLSFHPYENMEDFTFTRDIIAENVTTVRPYLTVVYLCLVPVIFLFAIMYYIYVLFWLIFGAFLVWIVGKARGVQLSYKRAYIISVYSVSAALIFKCIMFLFVPTPIPIPFLFTIIFLASVIANLDPKAFAEKGE